MRLFSQCKVYTWKRDTKGGRLSPFARAMYACIAPGVWFEDIGEWLLFRDDNFLSSHLYCLTSRQVKRLCGKSLKEMTKMFHRIYARRLKEQEEALKFNISITQSKVDEIAKCKKSFWSNKNNKARKGK